MGRLKILLSIVGLLVSTAIFAMNIAVYGFSSKSLSSGVVNSSNAVLTAELSHIGCFSVLDREKLDPIIKEMKLQEMGAVRDVIEVGKLAGADYVLYGTMERSPGNRGKIVVVLNVVDVKTGKVVVGHTETVDEDDVIDAVRCIADLLTCSGGSVTIRPGSCATDLDRTLVLGPKERFSVSFGVFIIPKDFFFRDFYILPWYSSGVPGVRTVVGVNVYLGKFTRVYYGPLYLETGKMVFFIPYVRAGLKLWFLDLSLMYFLIPGLGVNFAL